jgi:Ca2+-binding RTX toxin-like protein
VTITAATQGGNPVYLVEHLSSSLDVFKFDFGPNCSEGSVNTKAVCKRLSGKLNLALGGGNDSVHVQSSGATSASVNLGTFNDTYVGIGGPDNVFASDGDDDVHTGGGNDDIRIGNGADKVESGSGDDEVTVGASSNSGGTDVVEGGPGDDNIQLHQDGNPFGRKTVSGGSGNDFVRTDEGNDKVSGGSGVDDIDTRGGLDEIDSKESDEAKLARADTVKCGFDRDEVTADLLDDVDAVNDPGGGTCEEVDRSPVGETPHVRILSKTLRVLPTGRVRVRLRCPRGVRKLGCKGRLQLRVARTRKGGVQASRSRRVRYRIRAGRRKTVTLKLTRRDVRTLRRHKRRRVKSRGILVSVEKGRKGRKTTVRNPRLKLR